ncbi:MAG TPA: hypothetical protein VF532_20755, partial [Candidatus Angelobacter sp.]
MASLRFWRRKVLRTAWLGLFLLFSSALQAQEDGIKPVPVFTGSTAYFTRVTGGQYQDAPAVSPLLLLPMGDKLLFEAKGSLADTFQKDAQGDYAGTVSYGLVYAQANYITKYVTVTGGRFTTPFGIYAERLAPNWIKALQVTPVIVPVTSLSSLGGMLRGGFP